MISRQLTIFLHSCLESVKTIPITEFEEWTGNGDREVSGCAAQ